MITISLERPVFDAGGRGQADESGNRSPEDAPARFGMRELPTVKKKKKKKIGVGCGQAPEWNRQISPRAGHNLRGRSATTSSCYRWEGSIPPSIPNCSRSPPRSAHWRSYSALLTSPNRTFVHNGHCIHDENLNQSSMESSTDGRMNGHAETIPPQGRAASTFSRYPPTIIH